MWTICHLWGWLVLHLWPQARICFSSFPLWIQVYLGGETWPGQWWLRAAAAWNSWSLGEEWGRRRGGGGGGAGGLGQACQTLFSSWSWGVKLCVDVCMSWPLIRGWDAAAPDPHGRIAGWVCSDPATLMPLTPTPPHREVNEPQWAL